jgi:hypothetical protein
MFGAHNLYTCAIKAACLYTLNINLSVKQDSPKLLMQYTEIVVLPASRCQETNSPFLLMSAGRT